MYVVTIFYSLHPHCIDVSALIVQYILDVHVCVVCILYTPHVVLLSSLPQVDTLELDLFGETQSMSQSMSFHFKVLSRSVNCTFVSSGGLSVGVSVRVSVRVSVGVTLEVCM